MFECFILALTFNWSNKYYENITIKQACLLSSKTLSIDTFSLKALISAS